jgi:endoglucanase
LLTLTSHSAYLLQENFTNGYPGHEKAFRKAMLDLIGQEKYDYFWDRFYTYFYSSADAEWFASIGLNMQRLAINYRHLSDDLDPYVINEAGFKWIDRVVKIVSFPQGSLGGDSDSSVAIGSSFPKPD